MGQYTSSLAVVLLLLFFEQITYGLFYSDLSFIAEALLPGKNKDELGYYAGFIVSAFYLGQLPGCLLWGYLGDKYGRKSCLVIVAILDSICVYFFGFLTNYYWGITLRLVWGIADGHYSLIKTMVADYSDEKSLPLNSAFIFLAVCLGNTFAPILGGYITNPAFYPQWLKHLIPALEKNHFLMPFLVCGSGLLLSKETLPSKQEEEPLLKKESSYCYILQNKSIIVIILLYGLEALIQCSYDSLISLWLRSDPSVGGFDASLKEIGWMLSFIHPLQAGNLVILPVFSKVLSVKKIYTVISLLQCIALFLTPFTSKLDLSSPISFTCFYLCGAIFHLCRSMLLLNDTSGVILLAEASIKQNRAKVYGVSQMLGGSGRFIGPPLLTSLFAWTITHSFGFPIDYSLCYTILALSSLIGAGLSRFI